MRDIYGATMRFDVESTKILYVVGVLFGIAAVLYFARDIVFDLSITVRALVLLLAFVVLLVVAIATERSVLVLVSSILSAAAYLAFLSYTLSGFDVGSDGTFLALLISAALFLGLGYLLRERQGSPSLRTAQYVVVAVVLVGAVIIGVDVVASDVEYDVTISDEGVVDDSGAVVIGTLRVDNQFVFREPIDAPAVSACIYGPTTDESEMRPLPAQYSVAGDYLPDSIPGSATITANITVRLPEGDTEAVDGRIPIEKADSCPTESESPRIVVVFKDDDVPRSTRP